MKYDIDIITIMLLYNAEIVQCLYFFR